MGERLSGTSTRKSETPGRNVRPCSDSANSNSDLLSLALSLTYKKKRKKGTEGGKGVKVGKKQTQAK